MAEHIKRETAIAKLTELEVTEPNATMTDAKRVLADIPAADVAPVVYGRWVTHYRSGTPVAEGYVSTVTAMRLIDADEALRLFGEEYEKTKELIHNGETHLDNLAEGFTEADHIIKYVLPTVDAVPVVRCKDCKYRDGTPGQPNILCAQMHEDDFCSYGERKEESHDRLQKDL